MRIGRMVLMLAAACVLCSEAAAQTKRPLPKPPDDPYSKPYDIKGLGLGTESTVVVAFASERCAPCTQLIPFYKRLLALPRMNGKVRRLVVVAVDGLWPVKLILDPHKFEPHRLTSGPYPAQRLPGVTATPSLLLLDGAGKTVGKWEGGLSAAQQEDVIAAINKVTPSRGGRR
jgi:hypothetical protein